MRKLATPITVVSNVVIDQDVVVHQVATEPSSAPVTGEVACNSC